MRRDAGNRRGRALWARESNCYAARHPSHRDPHAPGQARPAPLAAAGPGAAGRGALARGNPRTRRQRAGRRHAALARGRARAAGRHRARRHRPAQPGGDERARGPVALAPLGARRADRRPGALASESGGVRRSLQRTRHLPARQRPRAARDRAHPGQPFLPDPAHARRQPAPDALAADFAWRGPGRSGFHRAGAGAGAAQRARRAQLAGWPGQFRGRPGRPRPALPALR